MISTSAAQDERTVSQTNGHVTAARLWHRALRGLKNPLATGRWVPYPKLCCWLRGGLDGVGGRMARAKLRGDGLPAEADELALAFAHRVPLERELKRPSLWHHHGRQARRTPFDGCNSLSLARSPSFLSSVSSPSFLSLSGSLSLPRSLSPSLSLDPLPSPSPFPLSLPFSLFPCFSLSPLPLSIEGEWAECRWPAWALHKSLKSYSTREG
eukprot:scaffold52144_cov33-Tisochrysis_lutea.AAC.4